MVVPLPTSHRDFAEGKRRLDRENRENRRRKGGQDKEEGEKRVLGEMFMIN